MWPSDDCRRGFDALCRAADGDFFADGHRAAAMIAGYYLSGDPAIAPEVGEAMQAVADRLVLPDVPYPGEPSDPGAGVRVAEALEPGAGDLRQAGHNVIFASLGLRVLRDFPELGTPARLEGLCRLPGCFHVTPVVGGRAEDVPAFADRREAARFVLGEFIDCVRRFEGRGQGWSGHLLTFAAALFDLRAAGFPEVASRAEEAFGLYVRRIRHGPLDSDVPREEHPVSEFTPAMRAYWERKAQGDPGLGHVLKYPYGFYRLCRLAEDPELVAHCLYRAYRVF